jgi:hypothetical protein
MILALETSEIATHRGHGERGRSWKKMEERLLFNGVYIMGDRTAIDKGIKFSPLVLSNPTETSFRKGDNALMIAKETLHLPIL